MRWSSILQVIGAYLRVSGLHDHFHQLTFTFSIAPLFGAGVTRSTYCRNVVEAANDVVYFAMLMATIYLINFISARVGSETGSGAIGKPPPAASPHFFSTALNAISTVMYERYADWYVSRS